MCLLKPEHIPGNLTVDLYRSQRVSSIGYVSLRGKSNQA